MSGWSAEKIEDLRKLTGDQEALIFRLREALDEIERLQLESEIVKQEENNESTTVQ
ncbi:MAG: hypothetical protein WC998_00660 [Candidatus Paceibacterota bacterium]|jgi:hypothetical protein